MNFYSPENFLGCKIKTVKSNGVKICFGVLILGIGLACLVLSMKQFTHPADAIKGDYFSSDFSQTEIQLQHLASKLGVSEKQILNPNGISHISVNSKIDPKYPWFLSIKVEATNAPEKIYAIHLEGMQPYN
jgi:hypothetical protein